MTDEIDVLKKAILIHEQALRLKDLNQELHSHLDGSIYWMLRYSEKYNIPLPKKEELIRMLKKSENIIDTITLVSKQPVGEITHHQPTGNTDKTTDKGTTPRTDIFN